MLPEEEFNQQEQTSEAKEYRLYNYDYPSEDTPDTSYTNGYTNTYDEEDEESATKSTSELLDENEDLQKENASLRSGATTAKILAIVFGVLFLLTTGYLVFAHIKGPLFGPIATEHKNYLTQTEELEMLKNKADTLKKANDMLVEQQPEIEDGVFFEVQIGAFQDFNLDAYQADLVALRQDGDATKKFTFAKFRDYDKAEKLKNDLQRMGVNGAFIVGRVNGKRTEDIQEAIQASKASF